MNVLKNNEIVLYGAVGSGIFDDGFTAIDVLDALAKLKGKNTITVRMNSGGGIVNEGVAIYNALKQHPGKKTVYVDGSVASAATIIAAAGDDIIMRPGSYMMVHDPMVITVGNAADHGKAVEALDTVAESMAAIYAEKTGRPQDEIRKEMKQEIWMTADEAVAKKYADRKEGDGAIEASAFDYRIYAKAPNAIHALSDTKKWSGRITQTAALPPKKEPTHMTEAEMQAAIAKAKADAEAEAKVKIEEATAKAAAETVRATEITNMCAAANVAVMASSLIKEGVTVADAKARIEGAKLIREAVATARKQCKEIPENIAETFIAAGTAIEAVRADLFDRIAKVQETRPTNGNHGATADLGSDRTVIASAWEKQVEAVNKRFHGAARQ